MKKDGVNTADVTWKTVLDNVKTQNKKNLNTVL